MYINSVKSTKFKTQLKFYNLYMYYLNFGTGEYGGGVHVSPAVSSLDRALDTAWAAGVGVDCNCGIIWWLRLCRRGNPTHSFTSRPNSSARARQSRDDTDNNGFNCLTCACSAGDSLHFFPSLSTDPDWLVEVDEVADWSFTSIGLSTFSEVDRDSIAALTPLLPISPVALLVPSSLSVFRSFGRSLSISALPNSQPGGSPSSQHSASNTVLSHTRDVYSLLSPAMTLRPRSDPQWFTDIVRMSVC